MQPKLRMPVSILAVQSMPNTIRERRLQKIEIFAHNIHALVGYQTDQPLPYALSHDSRFSKVHSETILQQDRPNMCRESFYTSFEPLITRERDVIRIA